MSGLAFPKTARLCHPREFKQVFAHGQRKSDSCFTLITHGNPVGQPRLGLVVARKNLRRAIDRNRVKRTIRESFREHRAQLPHLDFVVMVRAAAGNRTRQELRNALQQHWQRIMQRCAG